jgi:hypothetical protein
MTTPDAPDCARFDDALPDYLERTLDPESLAALDAHRASCPRCDALVRDLDAIRAEAAQLRPFAPSRDLWPGINASISTPVTSLTDARARRTHSRAWISTRVAAALILLTAGTTYVVARLTNQSPTQTTKQVATNTQPNQPGQTSQPSTTTPSATPSATPSTTTTPVARKLSAEATYAEEISALHTIVEQRTAQLDPHTRAVIEHNLQVIDSAIAESRRALAQDPHSALLADQLDQVLSTKMELLRTVALLPART